MKKTYNTKMKSYLITKNKIKTSKSIKSEEPPKENRYIFLKERLLTLDLNENVIEKILHFLLKTGEPEKILSELRSLTKSETHVNWF